MKKFIVIPALMELMVVLAALEPSAHAKVNAIEVTQKTAQQQVRHLMEPLLDKYCHDDCKLMSINATVDAAVNESIAPGFEEVDTSRDLAPSSARIKMLMSDRVGPNTKTKLLELLQTFLDTLDFPVTIDVQTAHFPQPTGQESKVAELRERITRQFKSTVEELMTQFCPQQCLVADYNLKTDVVNGEEAQYGNPGDYVQEGDTAIKIREVSATLLMDESLGPDERANILEMAKLKTNHFRNVSLNSKAMRFPRPGILDAEGNLIAGTGSRASRGLASSKTEKNALESSTKSETTTTNQAQTNNTNSSSSNLNSTSTAKSNENSTRQERLERIEKIERVESGDAVQAELKKFQVYGLVFACSIISLLIFIALSTLRPAKKDSASGVTRIIQSLASDPVGASQPAGPISTASSREERGGQLSKRFEIESILEELTTVFAQHPRVAKQVFTRVLTEEGVETTAQYITLFGENIVVDLLRDPSLQSDLNELLEFYAKNPMTLEDDVKLDLLRKLHNRTVAGKLFVMGNRSSNLFDFLAEMDGLQILELIRTESMTVKAIAITQCDPQKRGAIYAQLDPETRMKLLNELSRIDYLPRDYIFNVAHALKRKRRDNPRLNTEALPGSEVLVTLLERTGQDMQRTVVKSLEASNPDSARTVKSKLVSIETLRYLRDGQLLEVVLSLRHDELLQFLKGTAPEVKKIIFSKSPKELVQELEEELVQVSVLSREAYNAVERKVLNRMKLMASEGLINLIETNERMFGTNEGASQLDPNAISGDGKTQALGQPIKKVAGW